jgi:hypothetical protein
VSSWIRVLRELLKATARGTDTQITPWRVGAQAAGLSVSVVMAGLRHPRRVKSGLRCSTGDREAATIGVPCADADVFLVLVSP